MPVFRVQLTSPDGGVLYEESVSTPSAELAAKAITGEPGLKRGGKPVPGDVLRAKVYLEIAGARTLTRFYGPPPTSGTP